MVQFLNFGIYRIEKQCGNLARAQKNKQINKFCCMRRRAARNAIHWRAAKRWMEHYIKSRIVCVYAAADDAHSHSLTRSRRENCVTRALCLFCVACSSDTLYIQIQSAPHALSGERDWLLEYPFKMSANWKALLIHQSENLSCVRSFLDISKARECSGRKMLSSFPFVLATRIW